MDSLLDLQPLWRWAAAPEGAAPALQHPWGPAHRPDWVARGLIVWPRGGQSRVLQCQVVCPQAWRTLGAGQAVARLVLRWWADAAELRVDGQPVHHGDLFDTGCRWPLPGRWWSGDPLRLELELRSPLHDDGALLHSRLELEPLDPADPHGLLAASRRQLQELRRQHPAPAGGAAAVQVLGHAHLDLAWLWPVADTWRAAERTFTSVLALMERFPQLHFGQSTPALYAWLEQHRPALFAAIRAAMVSGRWEPLNGPWVECDCVLLSTASLLRQFQEGQHYSRRAFPEWRHELAWLPDSFGFSAGLPAVAQATGVQWFCTHKLAWNATNPFPHRLFRWRSRCGSELFAMGTAPIGTDGDPLAIEKERLRWQQVSGCAELLWLPGVGDHGGGPTAEMLEQLALWQGQAEAAPQHHGTLRDHLHRLAPGAAQWPVWRDELYLELHRGIATSRPDQKRHNRSLERLLREAELAAALLPAADTEGRRGASGEGSGAISVNGGAAANGARPDWRPLLFHQFHDILPGTAIPEVFEQAEPQWRAARRQARHQRDQRLLAGLRGLAGSGGGTAERWWLLPLQPLPAASGTLRLPAGVWRLVGSEQPLAHQAAGAGGVWVQLPLPAGVKPLALERRRVLSASSTAGGGSAAVPETTPPPQQPVTLAPAPELGEGRWRLHNGLVGVVVGPEGVEQLLAADGTPQLAAPLRWCRWADRGEFWDAWDLAADHRNHPLPWTWQAGPDWLEQGPLVTAFRWRGRCGTSDLRLDGRLRAGCPWLELTLAVQWRQRHELLRLEVPLARPAVRWAADSAGAVLERPAVAHTAREQARWEVSAVSWLASVGDGRHPQGAGVAVLLDGPQGVNGTADHLGVSLLRAPTWPDPGADNGWQRQRLALLPCPQGWRAAAVPQQARRLREPAWLHPQAPGPADGRSDAEPPLLLPPLGPDLALVALRAEAGGSVVLTVQNEGPCRRQLELGQDWRLLARLDGLDRPLPAVDVSPDTLAPRGGSLQASTTGNAGAGTPVDTAVAPWQLASWRLQRLSASGGGDKGAQGQGAPNPR